MDSYEQRKRIALIDGWRDVDIVEGTFATRVMGINPRINQYYTIEVPDYPQDLNALHEVEMGLDSREMSLYSAELFAMIIGTEYNRITTPAHIKVEAMLKALGHWDGYEQEVY